jgi:hypothetical protein
MAESAAGTYVVVEDVTSPALATRDAAGRPVAAADVVADVVPRVVSC